MYLCAVENLTSLKKVSCSPVISLQFLLICVTNILASVFQYSNIRIGPVVKKDVMKASTMLEHESQ
jgi:hypothetical protein